MARVTAAEVKLIITTTQTIDAHILAANALVTEKIGNKTIITDALKKEIERWLAAHFVACSIDRQVKVTRASKASDVYMGFGGGEGLKATTYGQTVLTLDATGEFANTGKRKARITTIEAIDVS